MIPSATPAQSKRSASSFILNVLSFGVPLVAIAACIWYMSAQLPWSTDYNRRPARQMLAAAMARPLPPRLSDLRVAGRQYLNKRWVRASFIAPLSATRILWGRSQCLASEKAAAFGGNVGVANHKYDSWDKAQVEWERLTHLRNTSTRFFATDADSEGYQWRGYVITDHRSGTIFVTAGGGTRAE